MILNSKKILFQNDTKKYLIKNGITSNIEIYAAMSSNSTLGTITYNQNYIEFNSNETSGRAGVVLSPMIDFTNINYICIQGYYSVQSTSNVISFGLSQNSVIANISNIGQNLSLCRNYSCTTDGQLYWFEIQQETSNLKTSNSIVIYFNWGGNMKSRILKIINLFYE